MRFFISFFVLLQPENKIIYYGFQFVCKGTKKKSGHQMAARFFHLLKLVLLRFPNGRTAK